jgi:alpha-1,6-mannosyltransferase
MKKVQKTINATEPIGYSYRGYNEIAIIGTFLSLAVVLFVIFTSFSNKNITTKGLIQSMFFVLVFYFFTTTTMHPWYLATPLFLSLFTRYGFTLVWSFVSFLSYFAYANDFSTEKYWILLLEYGVVYSVFFYELLSKESDIKNLT